ncbi:ninja-family protein AFP3-like [Humulus lupulus]|uniref:ninja-family protein AFP3-like n=1 Tax=Humulus lupulus TaxID=3486 RepID=UPI002B407323|nr:ninja-family protein AFP3-like [Humulus lupulus]
MAQTEEGQNIASQQQYVSIPMNNFSTDLLQRLVARNHFSEKTQDQNEDSDEIELSLGLSLNGRFGVDPRAINKLSLKRSSSISDFTPQPAGVDATYRHMTQPAGCPAPLMRTCSLPMETEEEWRRRKELQMLRRMEAKRKRSVKQRNYKAARDRGRATTDENGSEEDRKGVNGIRQNQEQSLKIADELSSMAIPAWVAGGRGSGGLEMSGDKGDGVVVNGDLDKPKLPLQPSFQGSVTSHGSGSSGITESISPSGQGGMSKCPEVVSPPAAAAAAVQPLPQSEPKPAAIPRPITREKSSSHSTKPPFSNNGAKEMVRNVMEDMPCVSTTGVGPNGKRIEGFLYRYSKGEEVRIVCVCHGSFLSPAEFVKHAGGGDTDHPLKHIVVNPTSFL